MKNRRGLQQHQSEVFTIGFYQIMVIRQKSGKASAKAKAKREINAAASEKKNNNSAPTPTTPSLFTRAFQSDAKLEPAEIIDVSYWLRQVIALFMGVVYGATKVTGQIGITSFLCSAIMVPPAFIKRIHPFDEDELGKIGSVSTEGLMPGFALFILSWIVTYTVFL